MHVNPLKKSKIEMAIYLHLDSLLYMNSLDSLLYMNPALLAHAHIRFLIGIFILHKTRQRFWLS